MSDQPALFQTLDRGMALIAVLVVCALTLAALLRQPLFLGVTIDPAGVDELPADEGADADHATVSTHDTLPDPRALARLQTYMAREKPFLQPDLTIRSLARRMGMGQRELSQIINRQSRVHFFDFVNRYRIEWAVALLSHPAHEGTSILEIAHQSGFNTKSSFNAAFGKHEGTTPTALRLRLTTDQATASL